MMIKRVSTVLYLIHVSRLCAVCGSKALTHNLKRSSPGIQDVPLYAQLDVSETDFMLSNLFSHEQLWQTSGLEQQKGLHC